MVLLWFFYNLLFTFKRSLKILAAHLAIVAVVLALVQSVNHVEVAQFFNLSDTLAHAYEGISVQSMCFKTLIVAMQLGFTLVALFVSHKLIPIYQKYIEQNESNAAYNLLWIKEVGRIALLVTTAYVFLMVFITYTTAIIYYAVLIVAYMRMINILIQHVTLDNFDELYDRLGVKWSWRKMWYVEQNASNLVSDAKTQYGAIIEWINSDHPYVNPQFSFKEIVMQFSGVTYNDFNELIEEDKGMNFQAYVRECRINHAVELMDRADNLLLLKEIASKVGFDSSTAFSRAFKAVKGVSASEWRVRK